MATQLGCVVIGRNEGERLGACLDSVLRATSCVVYVDSGSTDGSPSLAVSRGVAVLQLDDNQPFTAARGRNEGAFYFRRTMPGIEFVQFVDGDCELVAGWLERGAARLREHSDLAAVCGRVRERSPDRSIYSRLCDIEWNTPVGEALACGGNAMMRLSALRDVGGFNPDLIAGEEPELCVRLRRAGYRIERLDADMVFHDAGITRLGQWWRRAIRAGYAYAEGASLHGDSSEQHWVAESRRIWIWGALLPSIVVGGALPTAGASTLLLWAYPVSTMRVYAGMRRRGFSRYDSLLYGLFLTVGKFAELQGALTYHLRRLRGEEPELIEYKGPRKSKPPDVAPVAPRREFVGVAIR